ncbi:predicted protein [Postia placenta Mad-698-R]|nr:predicted protein [Postia placenta Mad-698-R]
MDTPDREQTMNKCIAFVRNYLTMSQHDRQIRHGERVFESDPRSTPRDASTGTKRHRVADIISIHQDVHDDVHSAVRQRREVMDPATTPRLAQKFGHRRKTPLLFVRKQKAPKRRMSQQCMRCGVTCFKSLRPTPEDTLPWRKQLVNHQTLTPCHNRLTRVQQTAAQAQAVLQNVATWMPPQSHSYRQPLEDQMNIPDAMFISERDEEMADNFAPDASSSVHYTPAMSADYSAQRTPEPFPMPDVHQSTVASINIVQVSQVAIAVEPVDLLMHEAATVELTQESAFDLSSIDGLDVQMPALSSALTLATEDDHAMEEPTGHGIAEEPEKASEMALGETTRDGEDEEQANIDISAATADVRADVPIIEYVREEDVQDIILKAVEDAKRIQDALRTYIAPSVDEIDDQLDVGLPPLGFTDLGLMPMVMPFELDDYEDILAPSPTYTPGVSALVDRSKPLKTRASRFANMPYQTRSIAHASQPMPIAYTPLDTETGESGPSSASFNAWGDRNEGWLGGASTQLEAAQESEERRAARAQELAEQQKARKFANLRGRKTAWEVIEDADRQDAERREAERREAETAVRAMEQPSVELHRPTSSEASHSKAPRSLPSVPDPSAMTAEEMAHQTPDDLDDGAASGPSVDDLCSQFEKL